MQLKEDVNILEKIKENNIFSKSTEGNIKNNQLGEVTVGNELKVSLFKNFITVVRDGRM